MHESGSGTNRTNGAGPMMSVLRCNPEVVARGRQGSFWTQSGHHGSSPRRVPFSLDDDCTLVAELEATSSRRSQVVKDRSVKDLLGPVGADSYRQDRRSGAGRYQKEGLEGQA